MARPSLSLWLDGATSSREGYLVWTPHPCGLAYGQEKAEVQRRGVGQGTPIERRERLREYRWSSYRGYAGLEKMKWSDPAQKGLGELAMSHLVPLLEFNHEPTGWSASFLPRIWMRPRSPKHISLLQILAQRLYKRE